MRHEYGRVIRHRNGKEVLKKRSGRTEEKPKNQEEEAMNRKIFIAVFIAALLIIFTASSYAIGWGDRDAVGAVYTMTNDATDNEVVIFDRDEDGILTKTDSISTGGAGSGGGLDPLASQGAVTLSANHRWLLTVNAGSNEVSVFRISPEGLKLTDKVDSGGEFPVSVTILHDLVYVLNAGMSSNITGFNLSQGGNLIPLAGSTRLLGTGAFSQVGFDPQGDTLVVTDRSGVILVYPVHRNGLPAMSPVISTSNGPVPFAFIFDRRGHLVVVEAGSNAVSTYNILRNGTLQVISPSVANGQIAACWIAGNTRGHIFTSNPGTSSISSYKLKPGSGKISLLDGVAGDGDAPLDMAVSTNGRFLYALDPGNGGIDMYRIERDGSLTDLGTIDGGLSIFAQGIAAR